jgi:hypothetical protein
LNHLVHLDTAIGVFLGFFFIEEHQAFHRIIRPSFLVKISDWLVEQ